MLSVFYFKIENRPGHSHGKADSVSHIPQDTREVQTGHVCNASNGNDETSLWCLRWTAKEQSLHEHEDPEICHMIGWVKDGKRPSKEDITHV